MSVSFAESETRGNLMRAFAGESMARNRYMFSADFSRKEHLHVLERLFRFTADQEQQHAKIFYNHLKELNGTPVIIDAGYPVDNYEDASRLLRAAQHNEYEEHDDVYQRFGDKAKEEGFSRVASSFYMIAEIEKKHGDRFGKFAELVEQNRLFVADSRISWMCLKCGHIFSGTEAPRTCPVCSHDQGYFLRLDLCPAL